MIKKMGKKRIVKTISESETMLSIVMMPVHANHYGSVHGGVVLKLVDEAAFVSATKHSKMNVVMASMHHFTFKHPVGIGDILMLKAHLCYAGRTSMEVEVEIETEKLKEGKILKIGSAFITMIGLDKNNKPAEVPGLVLKTEKEKLKARQVLERRKERLNYISKQPK